MGKILVTGGAGYIGSHVVKKLGEENFDILVVDNLSNGYKEAVTYGELLVGDIGDQKVLDKIFENQIDGILHFAGSIIVPESVEKPELYYQNNTENSLKLISRAVKENVKGFIFSSTAAVYGESKKEIVTEEDQVAPTNPYGASKLMTERMLQDISNVRDLNYVIFRYFNVAGSSDCGKLGIRGENATHLMKVCAQAATKKRESMTIFGTDWDTKDGTGVRDYIHVEDLADVHVLGIKHLLAGGDSALLNCGYTQGYSVKEVVSEFKKVSGVDFSAIEGERRAGDIGCLIANSEKAKSLLGWTPKKNQIETIVKSAFEWEKKI